jgi:tetratricopeptide (TPR) repeat protein
LRKIHPPIGKHAPQLAELCGYLPLALRISAELLADDDTRDVADYLKQLQSEHLKHLADPDNPDDPAASVEASLQLSYAALPPEAQTTFAQLGVFVADFPLDAAQAVVALASSPPPSSLPDTLGLLRRRSLLDYDAASERYDLHDLARVFALARLSEHDNERLTRLRYAQHYAEFATYVQMDLYLEGKQADGLVLFDRERRQIDAAWEWAMNKAKIQDVDEAIDSLLIKFAHAVFAFADMRYDLHQERIPQLEAHLEAARRQMQRSEEGFAIGNLGRVHHRLGEHQKAIEYHEKALIIMREISDRKTESSYLRNLGSTYLAMGDDQRAMALLMQALEGMRETGYRRGELFVLGDLGSAYYALGEYQRAIEF